MCPYCGYNDQSRCTTQEAEAIIGRLNLMDRVVAPELKNVERELKRASDEDSQLKVLSPIFPKYLLILLVLRWMIASTCWASHAVTKLSP